ncbi:hypothetical protein RE6C_02386 [Rhodopirellula europaea 6C]|uniref:Uncharacterized protein n=1 Tax=Rhodopirellula europaea 6C TaxID=1263867 RepID=M2AW22_9BACT|nr:hypothetical protein RE6C_02386 [Rhodopirellula europaea 6C]
METTVLQKSERVSSVVRVPNTSRREARHERCELWINVTLLPDGEPPDGTIGDNGSTLLPASKVAHRLRSMEHTKPIL